jgi:S1-C subfamily serine protease
LTVNVATPTPTVAVSPEAPATAGVMRKLKIVLYKPTATPNGGYGFAVHGGVDKNGERAVVRRILPGSPADRSGLLVGDLVRRVGGGFFFVWV